MWSDTEFSKKVGVLCRDRESEATVFLNLILLRAKIFSYYKTKRYSADINGRRKLCSGHSFIN